MKPVVKVAVRYGFLAGITGWILLLVLYYIGRHPVMIPVYMDFRIILFVVFIFFSLREIRDYYQNGILYFSQGILASFLFTACYGVLASFLLFIFMHFEPDFLADYIRLSIETVKSLPAATIEKIGKDAYNRNLELLPHTDISDLTLLYFFQSFLISLFISIILSVILRRQPKT
jgi:hypothetical protein